MNHACTRWAILAACIFGFLPLKGLAQPSPSLLNTLFGDHGVFQRGTPINLWGKAAPGEEITVSMAGEVATTEADSEGNWSATLPGLEAGGPHTLDVRSGGGLMQSVSDLLVGDVYFCSGQSNMELQVSRTLNSPAEIRSATNDRIRLLRVNQAATTAPQDTLVSPVRWEKAGPETVPSWSATCYYFAREIARSQDVPIGLINSSWGGSDIRAWMSQQALASTGKYDEDLRLLRLYNEDERAAQQAFGERWQAWWKAQNDNVEPWQPQAGVDWLLAPEGLGDWNEWDAPGMRGYTGMVWYRATFELTGDQAQQDAELSLGGIDEVDQTWINGQVVGNTFGYGTERTYAIPAELLRVGENVVVVNVLNTYGSGGMVGDPSKRALLLENGSPVPLDSWRYQVATAVTGFPPRVPWESVGGRSTLHNAMVAPLRNYGLRGVVWYQGESNTGESDEYLQLLEALIAQWRGQFGADLPVLVVQLANYGHPSTRPTESGWAEVREAQRLATRDDPRAAYVVTIDIGSSYDVHPANKQEVGRRLARAASHIVYGESVTSSGPKPAGATRKGDHITVTFEEVDGSLVAYGHTSPIGFELCGEERGSCRYAEARIEGLQVVLPNKGEEALTRVRYCWADSPVCTLYDEAGLPAVPFELYITE